MISVCIFPTAMIRTQDQEKHCDSYMEFQRYKALAQKANTLEEFDQMWAKAAPYRNQRAEEVKQIRERVIKHAEITSVILYIASGLLAANIVMNHFRG